MIQCVEQRQQDQESATGTAEWSLLEVPSLSSPILSVSKTASHKITVLTGCSIIMSLKEEYVMFKHSLI